MRQENTEQARNIVFNGTRQASLFNGFIKAHFKATKSLRDKRVS